MFLIIGSSSQRNMLTLSYQSVATVEKSMYLIINKINQKLVLQFLSNQYLKL
ncbi:hypothetical protein TTHERM_000569388 (macronuclear) [Tetrahymena thermophila SB210]|uniref:Uncharacterized protein n=1 Tax=Tetrahymena thermophila (strain SB210) TaxID=312017 RepID=W7XH11_TETTS|nr:hypothetical protein TTHERM_000569388 [Tetrahymena thermophila SB210]EWS72289.1 hypothetical protein TTHERM_000569388 [Tetrahymena thermophila SB210]|eukprot:XP_012655229.1 hypothetical protein TTHERM_000569388 [Tetrahymena thermophila SB210]